MVRGAEENLAGCWLPILSLFSHLLAPERVVIGLLHVALDRPL